MNTKPDQSEFDLPQSTEAFGHPVTTGVKYDFSDHKPGFDKSLAPDKKAANSGKYLEGAEVVPPVSDKAPQTPLSECIRQGLPEKEKE